MSALRDKLDRFNKAKADQMMDKSLFSADMALAIGILLGADYPGCAAAVANAYEQVFKEKIGSLS